MLKSKKAILAIALLVAVLAVSTVGVAFAQTPSGDEGQTKPAYGAELDRVCEIYQANTGVAIDSQKLKDAFAQAGKEMRDKALDSWLQKLVDQGKITSEQVEQYKTWWQARPDAPLPGGFWGHGFRGGMKWRGGCPSAPTPQATGSTQ